MIALLFLFYFYVFCFVWIIESTNHLDLDGVQVGTSMSLCDLSKVPGNVSLHRYFCYFFLRSIIPALVLVFWSVQNFGAEWDISTTRSQISVNFPDRVPALQRVNLYILVTLWSPPSGPTLHVYKVHTIFVKYILHTHHTLPLQMLYHQRHQTIFSFWQPLHVYLYYWVHCSESILHTIFIYCSIYYILITQLLPRQMLYIYIT